MSARRITVELTEPQLSAVIAGTDNWLTGLLDNDRAAEIAVCERALRALRAAWQEHQRPTRARQASPPRA